jgi:flagellar hook-length control protein FliK
MQVTQLPIQIDTKPTAKSNTRSGNSDSTAKSEFLKLVEQLTGTGNCDNILPPVNSKLQSDTKNDSTNSSPLSLINTDDNNQNSVSDDNSKQAQLSLPQIMQVISIQDFLSQASNIIERPIYSIQNSKDGVASLSSTQQVLGSSSVLSTAIQEPLVSDKSLSHLLQVAKLIVNLQHATKDVSNASNANLLDEKSLKVLGLLSQAAKQLIKSSGGSGGKSQQIHKTTEDKTFEKISNDTAQQQISAQPIISSLIQLIAPLMQNNDIAKSNTQTQAKPQTNAQSILASDARSLVMQPNFINLKSAEYKSTTTETQPPIIARTIQGEEIIDNSTYIDTKQEFSTDKFNTNSKAIENDLTQSNVKTQSNILPRKDDLQNLFEQLNVITIQSSESNKTPQITQLNIETPAQAFKTIKTLCETAPMEVNSILKAAQENTNGSNQNLSVSDVLSLLNSNDVKDTQVYKFYLQPPLNSMAQTNILQQSLPMAGSITPFQLKIYDQNGNIDTKTEKQTDASQSGKSVDGLKLSHYEAFTPIQAVSENDQGNAVKTNNQNYDTVIQDKSINAVNVNAFSNVQAFTLNANDSSDNSQAKSIVKQTTNAIVDLASKNQSDFKLHLSPEDLGGITIKMVSRNGTISIQIIADNPRTGQLLSSSIGDLNSAISQHGIILGKSEILHTGNNTSFSTGDFSGQRQQTGQQQSQQHFEQYKQSESPKPWSPIMEDTELQANIIIPQSITVNYDNVA